ncbi:MAG: hypothetical protein KatS3mg050_0621 [Litorilinea sp.]|nr:MAG: hypothetical protein KatS3mg050_0621 [Litorilinea sp.]
MADPKAVADAQGEWIELVNLEDVPVNLRDWILADLDRDRHPIATELWIPPGGYLVLARNSDPGANGGVQAQYQYTGLDLANGEDELLLISPDGVEVDRVLWGRERGLPTTPGASLERVDWYSGDAWQTATGPWPGSAGDWGSPGQPYVPAPPTPTATPIPPAPSDEPPPTSIPTPAPVSTSTLTPVSPTPVPTPTPTVPVAPPPRLRISEFLADPKAVADAQGEWIELVNLEDVPVNLQDWILADLDRDWHPIATELWIPPGGYLVLARNSDPGANGGVQAQYQYTGLDLANGEDELLLISPDGVEVDRVLWGRERPVQVVQGASLERTDWDSQTAWAVAEVPWPGSLGDRGSPGQPFRASLPTATPPPPTPSATPTPCLGGYAPTHRHAHPFWAASWLAATGIPQRDHGRSSCRLRPGWGVAGALQRRRAAGQPEWLDPGRPGERPPCHRPRPLAAAGCDRGVGAPGRPGPERWRTGGLRLRWFLPG